MTLMQKDSQLINTSLTTPTTSASLINNFEGEIDKNVLNIFKSIVRDIDDFKASLNGITRQAQYDNMLFIYNRPNQRETNIQEALRMDKYGYFAIGTEYPRWQRARVDVNGAVYAIPQWGRWSQSVIVAGVGNFVWDTETYNPNTDIYSRVVGNTGIRIDEPGTYEVKVNLLSQNTVDATGTRQAWAISRNGIAISILHASLCADDFAFMHGTVITLINRGDVIAAQTVSANMNRFGDASPHTWIEICKVN